MPYFPTLNETRVSRLFTDTFKGYCRLPRISEGQFYDTFNLSSDGYPLAVTRRKRGVDSFASFQMFGFDYKDNSWYMCLQNLSGTQCYVLRNGRRIRDLTIPGTEKQKFVHFGTYLVLFPAKVWINTAAVSDEGPGLWVTAEYGSLENTVTLDGAGFTICDRQGTSYTVSSTGSAEPESPADGAVWLDTSAVNPVIKQYSDASGMWTQLATTYIKIYAAGINTGFSKGDGVTISGAELSGINAAHVIQATGYDAALGFDYIVVPGIMPTAAAVQEAGAIEIKRTVPDMDFVVEAGNRLWGCKSGTVGDKVLNEIYCCKLGDFKNWNCFDGISTDSWAAGVGSDGNFTGAVNYTGNPMFFKENCFHKVQISSSGAHQVIQTNCPGVQKGCGGSLAIVNGVLYYKSDAGVYAYSGSLPASVSEALGDVRYSDASAGALDNKYYISMKQYIPSGETIEAGEESDRTWKWTKKESSGEYVYSLFVYDTARDIWYREDNTHAIDFARFENDLFYIDISKDTSGNDVYRIKNICATVAKAESTIGWSLHTGQFGHDYPDKKYLSRIDVRMSLEKGAQAEMAIEYDSSGVWEEQGKVIGTGNPASFLWPVIPRRCEHLRIRLRGVGMCKIYSIAKNLELGGDM